MDVRDTLREVFVANSFFDALSDQEKQFIKERTIALTASLKDWSRRYPSVRAARIPATAMSTVAVLPQMSIPDVLTMAQITLWIFMIDDKAAQQEIAPAQMRRKAEQWCLMAAEGAGNGPGSSDELTAILLDILENLSRSSLFEPLRRYWAERLGVIVEAMAWDYMCAIEYRCYGARGLPSLDEYLRNGKRSIGLPLWGATSLILSRDPSAVERLAPINAVIDGAGVPLRLYNDIATLDKEIQVGDVNSILVAHQTMLAQNPGMDEQEAWADAKGQIANLADSSAQQCYHLLEEVRTQSGQFEETISRLISFHAHFYGDAQHDYHTTSLAEAYQMLKSQRP